MKQPFKSNIVPITDAQLATMSKPVPFAKCVCGRPKISSEHHCVECRRLAEIGFGPFPRGPQGTIPDTQAVQSFDAFNHKGYSDTIGKGKK
jgi:hypothetical protein